MWLEGRGSTTASASLRHHAQYENINEHDSTPILPALIVPCCRRPHRFRQIGVRAFDPKSWLLPVLHAVLVIITRTYNLKF